MWQRPAAAISNETAIKPPSLIFIPIDDALYALK
jgi:hypothetical protein